MLSRKITHNRINRNFFAMTCPSCNATVCTVPCVRHRNGAGTGASITTTEKEHESSFSGVVAPLDNHNHYVRTTTPGTQRQHPRTIVRSLFTIPVV